MRTSQGMFNEDADRARFKLSLFPFFLFSVPSLRLFPNPLFNANGFDTFQNKP